MNQDSPPAQHRLDLLYSPPEIGAPGVRRTRERRRDLLLSGIFILAMALTLLAILALLTGRIGHSYRLSTYLGDADGLDLGIPVQQNGYGIGLVERVRPILPGSEDYASHCPQSAITAHQPCFRVLLRIHDPWPIPGDSKARLASAGLLKGTIIEILPGSAGQMLAGGDTITALDRAPQLVDQLDTLVETVQDQVGNVIAPALENLRDQIALVSRLLGTGEDQDGNQQRLAGALDNLRSLTAKLDRSVDAGRITDIQTNLDDTIRNLSELTQALNDRSQKIQQAIDSYEGLAGDVRGLVQENRPALRSSLDDSRYLLQQLAASLTPILANIEETTRNLAALSRELRQDPSSLLKEHEQEDPTPWFQ